MPEGDKRDKGQRESRHPSRATKVAHLKTNAEMGERDLHAWVQQLVLRLLLKATTSKLPHGDERNGGSKHKVAHTICLATAGAGTWQGGSTWLPNHVSTCWTNCSWSTPTPATTISSGRTCWRRNSSTIARASDIELPGPQSAYPVFLYLASAWPVPQGLAGGSPPCSAQGTQPACMHWLSPCSEDGLRAGHLT